MLKYSYCCNDCLVTCREECPITCREESPVNCRCPHQMDNTKPPRSKCMEELLNQTDCLVQTMRRKVTDQGDQLGLAHDAAMGDGGGNHCCELEKDLLLTEITSKTSSCFRVMVRDKLNRRRCAMDKAQENLCKSFDSVLCHIRQLERCDEYECIRKELQNLRADVQVLSRASSQLGSSEIENKYFEDVEKIIRCVECINRDHEKNSCELNRLRTISCGRNEWFTPHIHSTPIACDPQLARYSPVNYDNSVYEASICNTQAFSPLPCSSPIPCSPPIHCPSPIQFSSPNACCSPCSPTKTDHHHHQSCCCCCPNRTCVPDNDAANIPKPCFSNSSCQTQSSACKDVTCQTSHTQLATRRGAESSTSIGVQTPDRPSSSVGTVTDIGGAGFPSFPSLPDTIQGQTFGPRLVRDCSPLEKLFSYGLGLFCLVFLLLLVLYMYTLATGEDDLHSHCNPASEDTCHHWEGCNAAHALYA